MRGNAWKTGENTWECGKMTVHFISGQKSLLLAILSQKRLVLAQFFHFFSIFFHFFHFLSFFSFFQLFNFQKRAVIIINTDITWVDWLSGVQINTEQFPVFLHSILSFNNTVLAIQTSVGTQNLWNRQNGFSKSGNSELDFTLDFGLVRQKFFVELEFERTGAWNNLFIVENVFGGSYSAFKSKWNLNLRKNYLNKKL